MKRTIIFSAFIAIVLASTIITNGQIVGLSMTTSGDTEVTTVRFRAPADRNFVIYEATPRARSEAECFAARDFTSAVPVGPERAVTFYDPGTAVWYLKNTNSPGSASSCSVILLRSSIDATDLAMWQSNYGSSGGFAEEEGNLVKDADPASRTAATQGRGVFILSTSR